MCTAILPSIFWFESLILSLHWDFIRMLRCRIGPEAITLCPMDPAPFLGCSWLGVTKWVGLSQITRVFGTRQVPNLPSPPTTTLTNTSLNCAGRCADTIKSNLHKHKGQSGCSCSCTSFTQSIPWSKMHVVNAYVQ